MQHITLKCGDITTAEVDAIVNAANPIMLGGGGVDGAIHRAAGPALLEECYAVEPDASGNRCPIGQARITGAGNLSARHVIHTVGPRYGIDENPPALLASAYRNTFELAQKNHCHSLAVPAVSCGVYGYPLAEAADIALATCCKAGFSDLSITFYLFGDEIFNVFSAALNKH